MREKLVRRDGGGGTLRTLGARRSSVCRSCVSRVRGRGAVSRTARPLLVSRRSAVRPNFLSSYRMHQDVRNRATIHSLPSGPLQERNCNPKLARVIAT